MGLIERLIGTVRGEVKVDLRGLAIVVGIVIAGAIIVTLLIKLL